MVRVRPADVGDDGDDQRPGARHRRLRLDGERGSGLFGTSLGVGVFLLLMLVAVQVLTHLYATSVLEAVGYDAVQAVSAQAGGDVDAAEARARALLGDMSDATDFQWAIDEDEVVLRVTAQRRPVAPGALGERLGLDVIEREFRMRVERFR